MTRPTTLLCLALLAAAGCTSTGSTPRTASQSWQCRNDLEVRCSQEGCDAETAAGFTPMSVSFDDLGAMSVCAYSGCWEGTARVVRDRRFLLLIGHDLAFSTSHDAGSAKADVVLALDRADGVATLKVGEFAHPLLCQRGPSADD